VSSCSSLQKILVHSQKAGRPQHRQVLPERPLPCLALLVAGHRLALVQFPMARPTRRHVETVMRLDGPALAVLRLIAVRRLAGHPALAAVEPQQAREAVGAVQQGAVSVVHAASWRLIWPPHCAAIASAYAITNSAAACGTMALRAASVPA